MSNVRPSSNKSPKRPERRGRPKLQGKKIEVRLGLRFDLSDKDQRIVYGYLTCDKQGKARRGNAKSIVIQAILEYMRNHTRDEKKAEAPEPKVDSENVDKAEKNPPLEVEPVQEEKQNVAQEPPQLPIAPTPSPLPSRTAGEEDITGELDEIDELFGGA